MHTFHYAPLKILLRIKMLTIKHLHFAPFPYKTKCFILEKRSNAFKLLIINALRLNLFLWFLVCNFLFKSPFKVTVKRPFAYAKQRVNIPAPNFPIAYPVFYVLIVNVINRSYP